MWSITATSSSSYIIQPGPDAKSLRQGSRDEPQQSHHYQDCLPHGSSHSARAISPTTPNRATTAPLAKPSHQSFQTNLSIPDRKVSGPTLGLLEELPDLLFNTSFHLAQIEVKTVPAQRGATPLQDFSHRLWVAIQNSGHPHFGLCIAEDPQQRSPTEDPAYYLPPRQ